MTLCLVTGASGCYNFPMSLLRCVGGRAGVTGWVMILLLTTGCGGRSLGQRNETVDGGGVDSGVGEFCEGANKVAWGTSVATSVEVTTSRLVMDCCEGATLYFHTRDALGDDLSLAFRVAGDHWDTETWVLDGEADNPEVWVSRSSGPSQPEQQLSGWISVELEDGEDPRALVISCCLQVSQPGGELDGVHLFAHRVPVAPYQWEQRFGLWLLEDSDLTATEAASLPLASLELSFQPLLELGSIAHYSRSTHRLTLGTWYSSDYLVNSLPVLGTGGVPFVVTVDDDRLYLGAFFVADSSESFDGPTIVVGNMSEYEFVIEPSYPGGGPVADPDPRADPRLLELLSSAGKLAP